MENEQNEKDEGRGKKIMVEGGRFVKLN